MEIEEKGEGGKKKKKKAYSEGGGTQEPRFEGGRENNKEGPSSFSRARSSRPTNTKVRGKKKSLRTK